MPWLTDCVPPHACEAWLRSWQDCAQAGSCELPEVRTWAAVETARRSGAKRRDGWRNRGVVLMMAVEEAMDGSWVGRGRRGVVNEGVVVRRGGGGRG